MPVDPGLQVFLDGLAAGGLQTLDEIPLEEARALLDGMALLAGPPERLAAVEDRDIPGPAGPIAVRTYRPDTDGSSDTAGLPPVVAFFHGGGWVVGGIESHDAICHRLATGVPAVVVSVDYRLAPEHPFPAAVEDCLAATRWCAEHGDELQGESRRLAVVGDSAGGNLAAVTALHARDHGPPLAAQVLIYPRTDAVSDYPSLTANAEGFLLTAKDIAWFEERYCGHVDPGHPQISPMKADDHSGLPSTLVITAEFDPLRDEGEVYAERIRAAGGDAACIRYDGMIHGFYGMNALTETAVEAEREVVDMLRTALVPS